MAKDDYHIIVCEILEYMYGCLKTGAEVNQFEVKRILGDIPQSYQEYILLALDSEEYVSGIYISERMGVEVPTVTPGMMITPKGIEYLVDDAYMKKVKEYLTK